MIAIVKTTHEKSLAGNYVYVGLVVELEDGQRPAVLVLCPVS